MKKVISVVLAFIMVLSMGFQILAVESNITLIVNGAIISFSDAKPYIDTNNRTMVPVRFVSEALGAKVSWNDNAKAITITKDSRNILITINQPTIMIDSKPVIMDTVAVLTDSGRTFVPVKYIAEALNATVSWESSSKTITISSTIKKESDLKKPVAYEDVRGYINNNLYANECFGFTINTNQKGFTAELSNQEGYKYNFEHPTAKADDAVLSVYTSDFDYRLNFFQSNQQSHAQKTAADILAYDLSQYNLSVTNKMLGDKETAYVQVDINGKKVDYYAMLVNGYYVKWEVTFGTSNAEYASQLVQIVDSIRFDWIRE